VGNICPTGMGHLGIVVVVMFAQFVNNSSVEKYKLKIFDDKGKQIEEQTLTRSDLDKLDKSLPVSKAFIPLKNFNILLFFLLDENNGNREDHQ